jgi:hypothetical protein
MFEGAGAMALADGRTYVGEFKAGRWEGLGTLTSKDGKAQTGLWKDGQFVK